ncbi:hypothetical protein C4573_07030 [Candidatus Woesearchaeota archaeon]|nr:MAG: hypothetical protein C4573_07030 [Candidatus Woesearchaeota archaeon]
MVAINIAGFAEKVKEYLECPEQFSEDTITSTLDLIDPNSAWESRIGIKFAYTEAMMMAIARAYSCLQNCQPSAFGSAIADAVQQFAQPFPEQDNLCYPHFLFHGIAQPTLEGIVKKISKNSRIIHETLECRKEVIASYGVQTVHNAFKLSMSDGMTDDYFGIAYLFSKQEQTPNSATGYIAKCSFFLDETNKDIYVITVQGRRFGYRDPVRAADPIGEKKRLDAEREYSGIGNILGMSPRRFVLMGLANYGKAEGYRRIRVIKPEEHLMFIEGHNGFLGNYAPVIRNAGITTDTECYLEKHLQNP